MDHLETSGSRESKRTPSWPRVRVYDTLGSVRHHSHLVWAWTVLIIVAAFGGLAIFQIIWGHW